MLEGKQNGAAVADNSMVGPQKAKKEIYDQTISLLGLYPKELKSGSERGICTPTFIAALFTIAQMWKQSKCLPTDKSTKVVYTYNGICFSTKK